MNHTPVDSNGAVRDAQWHALAVEQAAERLATGVDGLSSDEARRRMERYGPNEIEVEREVPWWSR